jgi:hypothetical protein
MRVEREHCRPRAVKRAGKAVTAESLVSMRVHGEEPK